jgi:hypothetical protein
MELNRWYRKLFGPTSPLNPTSPAREELEKTRLKQIEDFWKWWNEGLAKVRKWIDDNIAKPILEAVEYWKGKWNEFCAYVLTWWDEHVTQKFNAAIATIGVKWDEFKQKVIDIVLTIKELWRKYISEPIETALTNFGTWWKEKFEDPVRKFLDGITDILRNLLNGIITYLLGLPGIGKILETAGLHTIEKPSTSSETPYGLPAPYKSEITVNVTGQFQNTEEFWRQITDKMRRDLLRQNP